MSRWGRGKWWGLVGAFFGDYTLCTGSPWGLESVGFWSISMSVAVLLLWVFVGPLMKVVVGSLIRSWANCQMVLASVVLNEVSWLVSWLANVGRRVGLLVRM